MAGLYAGLLNAELAKASSLSLAQKAAAWDKPRKSLTPAERDHTLSNADRAQEVHEGAYADQIVAHYSAVLGEALAAIYTPEKVLEAVRAVARLKSPPTSAVLKSSSCEVAGAVVRAQGHRPLADAPLRPSGVDAFDTPEHVLLEYLGPAGEHAQEVLKETNPLLKKIVLTTVQRYLTGAGHTAQLKAVVGQLHADSYIAGSAAARKLLAAKPGAKLSFGLSMLAATMGLDPPADYWDTWTPGYQGAADLIQKSGGLAALLAKANQTIMGLQATTINEIGRRIVTGLAAGDSHEKVASDIGDLIKNPARCKTIANTEYNRAMTSASVDTYAANDIEKVIWLAEVDCCPLCQANEDQGAVVLGGFENGDAPVHPNCFPAGTAVAATEVLTSYARWYDGDMVEIVTAAGHETAVTPNHPILTDQGWVAAGLLVEGAYVVSSSNGKRVAASIDPNHYNGPAAIEDVAKALVRAGASTAGRVPTATEDFHGDGAESDVYVVRANRFLRDRGKVGQPTQEQYLCGGLVDDQPLPRKRAGVKLLLRALYAAYRGVSRRRVSRVLRRGSLRGSQPISVRERAKDTRLLQDTFDWASADAVTSGELIARFPGEVALDEVVQIRRVPFSGHVYNLETSVGWYIANGIIAHNCRCAVVPDEASILASAGVFTKELRRVLKGDAYLTELRGPHGEWLGHGGTGSLPEPANSWAKGGTKLSDDESRAAILTAMQEPGIRHTVGKGLHIKKTATGSPNNRPSYDVAWQDDDKVQHTAKRVPGSAALALLKGEHPLRTNVSPTPVAGVALAVANAVPRLARPDTPVAAAKAVNKDFETNPGARINCQMCVTAYEMRRRGLDARARPTDQKPVAGQGSGWRGWLGVDARPQFIWNAGEPVPWYAKIAGTEADQDTESQTPAAALEHEAAKWPIGARGVVQVAWADGGSHVLNVEHRGVGIGVTFVDAQSGFIGSPADWEARSGAVKSANIARVDDKEIAPMALQALPTDNYIAQSL